jgi:hypothetical protein
MARQFMTIVVLLERKNEMGDALKIIEPDRNPARIYYPISYEKPEFKGGVFNSPNK